MASFVGDAVAWVSSTLFYGLGAYVGAVAALVLGGFGLLFTVVTGAVRVPFILAGGLASLYDGEYPLGAGGGGGAAPHPRRKKKLGEKPPFEAGGGVVAGAPAGAPASYDYGGSSRKAA